MMTVRSLTAQGTERFRMLLRELRNASNRDAAWRRLEQDFRDLATGDHARLAACHAAVDPGRRFGTRYEMARHLLDGFSGCRDEDVEGDAGLWTWLALIWIDQLLPRRNGAITSVPGDENFIASAEVTGARTDGKLAFRVWGRHAVRTTYLLVRLYGDLVEFMLSTPMHQRGEFVENMSQRAYLMSCEPVFRALALLYRDPVTGRPKTGAASKDKTRGPVRRFAELMRQYMVNYDLHSMSPEEIIRLLPRDEFRRFIPDGL